MAIPRTHAQATQHGVGAEGRPAESLDPSAPLRLPAPGDWSVEAHHERIAFLAARGRRIRNLAGLAPAPDPEALRERTANYIGMTQIPTGLIGPVRISGRRGSGDLYVPLATAIGELVATYDRGSQLITAADGATCVASRVAENENGASHFEARAEVVLPATLVRSRIGGPPDSLRSVWHLGARAAAAGGQWTVETFLIEGLSALFLACGQDVACGGEVFIELGPLQTSAEGGLCCGVALDGLSLDTRGGGAVLPTARECLAILGTEGEGEGAEERLAEVCAALALAGALSLIAGSGTQPPDSLAPDDTGPAEPAPTTPE